MKGIFSPILPRRRVSKLLIALLLLGIHSNLAQAQTERLWTGVKERNKTAARPICKVVVEVLEGYKKPRTGYRFSSFVSDVSTQLSPLPYTEYHQVEKVSEEIFLNDKHEFNLHDSKGTHHRLIIEPYAFRGDKVRLFVNWIGPNGEQFVSSKLRIKSGKNVLLGTEDSAKVGIVLSLKVACRRTN